MIFLGLSTLLLLLHTALVTPFGLSTAKRIGNFAFPNGLSIEGTVSDAAEAINGNTYQEIISEHPLIQGDEVLVSANQTVPVVEEFSPALKFSKYMTMQSKRVPVVIRYSGDAGLKPYFLTIAKKIKDSHPDVLLEKAILSQPGSEADDDPGAMTFEVLVDGKVVVSKNRKSAAANNNMVVFVNMHEIGTAITRARRKRRPQTVYGEDGTKLRLEMLKTSRDTEEGST